MHALGINDEKILVNPNGVDTDFYDPAKLVDERTEIRTRLHIEGKFVFGFIGTFSQWHGIPVIAHMIQELIKQHKHLHFLLIGDGPLCADLKKKLHDIKAEEYVTFTGILPNHKARSYLAACDAFLSPTQENPDGSRFFGSPTKMFEYMSLGKPIIASDLEQLSELLYPAVRTENDIVPADAAGFLVAPRDSNGFVKSAERVMSMSNEMQAVGENARLRAKKYYTWVSHVERISDFSQRGT